MTRTHKLAAATLWLAATAAIGASPEICGIGALVAWETAQLPDIDNPVSVPGRRLDRIFGLSTKIEQKFGHRGMTHWPITTIAIGALIATIAVWPALAFLVGGLSHIVLDCCTYQGVRLAPWAKRPWGIPYRLRIECGGNTERFIIYPIVSVMFVLALYISL